MKPRYAAILSLALLLCFDAGLFAPFLTGARWFIGNTDRFNQYLPALHAAGSGLAGWDPTIFAGVSNFGTPSFFPVGYEPWLIGADTGTFFHRALLLSFAFFFLSGLGAWSFLRDLFRSPWLALVGAILYQCAFASTLRITQNDQTFAVLALAPLLLLSARRAILNGSATACVVLAAGCAVLVWFTFLQEAAYVALLLAAYLAHLAYANQMWRRGIVAAACAGAGLTAGLPRLWLAGKELGQMFRRGGSRPFDELFEYQNIRPWEILRFFDDTIFGRNHAEAGLSNLNFSEGFQLFTAQLAPFLLLWLIISRPGQAPGTLPRPERRFHLAAFLTVTAVVCFKPVYHVLYLVFGRVDFYHTRVIVAGLLPVVTLTVAALERMLTVTRTQTPITRVRVIAAVASGITTAFVLLALASWSRPADFWPIPVGAWRWVHELNRIVYVYQPAVITIALSGIAVLTANWLIGRKTQWAHGVVVALAAMTVTQAALAARYQLLGPHTRGLIPFELGSSWQPDQDKFRPPTAAEVGTLRRQLEVPEYRAAVVCQDEQAYGLMANSIARFHDLELIDGYTNGVPRNLAWLPWPDDTLRLRQIHFSSARNLPWRTLALVGIKHAWLVDHRVFTADPARFAAETILTNPLPPVPRAFFPARVIARPTTKECQAWMLALPDAPRLDVETITVVHADTAPAAGGAAHDLLRCTTGPEKITLEVTPSAVDRFVVVNTRWHPGWSAKVDGRPLVVLEANGFMMGVSIPAHASTVELEFHALAWAFSRAKPHP